jgi:hypothetical protein
MNAEWLPNDPAGAITALAYSRSAHHWAAHSAHNKFL